MFIAHQRQNLVVAIHILNGEFVDVEFLRLEFSLSKAAIARAPGGLNHIISQARKQNPALHTFLTAEMRIILVSDCYWVLPDWFPRN